MKCKLKKKFKFHNWTLIVLTTIILLFLTASLQHNQIIGTAADICKDLPIHSVAGENIQSLNNTLTCIFDNDKADDQEIPSQLVNRISNDENNENEENEEDYENEENEQNYENEEYYEINENVKNEMNSLTAALMRTTSKSYHVQFTIYDAWNPKYLNTTSKPFHKFSTKLKKVIAKIYHNLKENGNSLQSNVVEIRKINDSQMMIMVDLIFSKAIFGFEVEKTPDQNYEKDKNYENEKEDNINTTDKSIHMSISHLSTTTTPPITVVCSSDILILCSDGKADCPNSEDELNCDPEIIKCELDDFKCDDGKIISITLQCDGYQDCTDGSDEKRCSQCQSDAFHCCSSECIPRSKRCDKQTDCTDLSDEENCGDDQVLFQCIPIRATIRWISPNLLTCSRDQNGRLEILDNELALSDENNCEAPDSLMVKQACKLPVLHSFEDSAIAQLDQPFRLRCHLIAGTPRTIIKWHRFDRQPISKHATLDIAGTLNFDKAKLEDAGEYECVATNIAGRASKQIKLSILKGPTIVSSDENNIITEVCDSKINACESVNTNVLTSNPTLIIGESECRKGEFNLLAKRPDECISCFCFGVSTKCASANLFTYSIHIPVTKVTVVGVVGPWIGNQEIVITDFIKDGVFRGFFNSFQLKLNDFSLNKETPYLDLSAHFHGNQLKSYGGLITYFVKNNGEGSSVESPNVILASDRYTLVHSSSRHIKSNGYSMISIKFTPVDWRLSNGTQATRKEIMLVLANIKNILIKIQYVDITQHEFEIFDITIDSAVKNDRKSSLTSLVEECKCPVGYSGLSCESCADGFIRQLSDDQLLGRCISKSDQCPPGTYGDPIRDISCKECSCPLTKSNNNNFAHTCSLASDGDIQCQCNHGYVGRRCETCDRGYIGDPLIPGGSCEPEPVNNCNPIGTKQSLSDGTCLCKEHVTGQYCDQCISESYYLNPTSDTGCIGCFCMGVTRSCTSTSWFRDTVQTIFTPNRNDFLIVSSYDPVNVVNSPIRISNNEASFQIQSGDTNVYYWKLPAIFNGNKLTAYGGNLKYTVRYVPVPGDVMSRNSAPDVVIHSQNGITILNYANDEDTITPNSSLTRVVPIREQAWQRLGGAIINREHLLWALADVSDILIKATYTTSTEEAVLSSVILDTANEHNRGGVRAYEIEQCSCPAAHQGLSCEDCSPGFTRGYESLYLNLCVPCECYGHSDECDREKGDCRNCRDNTAGINFDECQHGYIGNATNGTPHDCQRKDISICDDCDPRGVLSCDGSCTCKANVVGDKCNQCRQGTFNLKETNPLGCTECFCSGVSKLCSTQHRYRQVIPISIFDDKFYLTNRFGERQKLEHEPQSEFSSNEHFIDIYDSNSKTLYWSLSDRLLGNQIMSYGGSINFTIRNDGGGDDGFDNKDVIISGNGLTLFWTQQITESPNAVRLIESEWSNANPRGPQLASRADLLTVLSDIQSILIRANIRNGATRLSISDVSMDTSLEKVTINGSVDDIETCQCPAGYRGSNCETCDYLHYRHTVNESAGLLGATCLRCPCSQNAESCTEINKTYVACNCTPGYYGPECLYLIEKPNVKLTPSHVNATEYANIEVECQSRGSGPINYVWEKNGGNQYNYTYEIVDNLLRFDSIRESDQGEYRCTATNPYGSDSLILKVFVTPEQDPLPQPQPTNQTYDVFIEPSPYIGYEGFVVHLDCRSQPHATEVIWTKSGENQLPNHIIVEQGSLIIADPSSGDSGKYICSVPSSFSGGQSYSSTVDVYISCTGTSAQCPTQQQPTIKRLQEKYNLIQGSDFALNCELNGVSNPTSLGNWKRLYEPLDSNIQQNGTYLMIRGALPINRGVYVCFVNTENGSLEEGIQIEVEPRESPAIEIYPYLNTTVAELGLPIRISCRLIAGIPTPTIKWNRVDHQPISNNSTLDIPGLIHFDKVNLEDSGDYECVAENIAGRASKQIKLIIEQVPEIVLSPNRNYLSFTEEDEIKLECLANGVPTPTIKWLDHNNGEIHQPQPLSRSGSPYAIVLKHHASKSDEGFYTCIATNSAGEAKQIVNVLVQEKPDNVDT